MGGGGDVSLQLRCQRGQIQVDVLSGTQDWYRPRQLALGVYEILRCQQGAALVALVTPGVLRTEGFEGVQRRFSGAAKIAALFGSLEV